MKQEKSVNLAGFSFIKVIEPLPDGVRRKTVASRRDKIGKMRQKRGKICIKEEISLARSWLPQKDKKNDENIIIAG
ncbi:MAG: hypothetical protein GX075_11475 [Firmicutes bacterium]|nr:hypothetical protein [Bacillota bacterium]